MTIYWVLVWWKRIVFVMKAPVSRRVLGVADGGTLDSCIPITASIWGLLLPPLLLLPAAHCPRTQLKS